MTGPVVHPRGVLPALALALVLLRPGPLWSQAGEPEEWRLSPTPVLTLGGVDATGPTEFSNPYAAAFLGSQLVVLDGGSQQLRFFDLTGRHIRTLGRDGQGPGEFTNAAYLQPLPGDSLFVSDLQQFRYTVFDPAGRTARVISLAAAGTGGPLRPLGLLPDGSVVAWRPNYTGIMGDGLQKMSVTVFRVSPTGTRADSLRTLPFTTVQALSVGGARGWRVALRSGQLAPAVMGPWAAFGSPTLMEVFCYDARTGGWGQVRFARPVRLATAEDAASEREALRRGGAHPGVVNTISVVDTLPAMIRLLPGPDSTLWLFEAAANATAQDRQVLVLRPCGTVKARLRVPRYMLPLAVGRALIAGMAEDDAGASVIQLFAVEGQSGHR